MNPGRQKCLHFNFFTWDRRDPCFDARNFDARNFDAKSFDARHFDARNFDARNWMQLSPGRWGKRGPYFPNFDAGNFDARNWTMLTPGRWGKRSPYFRPTSHPDLKSHTSLHHHHNNLRRFRVNNILEYSKSTIS